MRVKSLLGFALAGVIAGGCGRGAERTTERMMEDALKEAGASDAHVQASDDGLRIESDGMAVQVAGDAEIGLPEGFPDDLMVPAGATVAYSMSSEGEGFSATLSVEDAPRAVFTFYVEALDKEGWEIRDKVEAGGQYLVSAYKEGRDVSVSIAEEDGEGRTMFTIVLALS